MSPLRGWLSMQADEYNNEEGSGEAIADILLMD